MYQVLDFIDEMRAGGLKMMVHCVAGRTRSPSITLLYLATRLNVLPTDSFEAAEEAFRRLYPYYSPTRGIREHIRRYWRGDFCGWGGWRGGSEVLFFGGYFFFRRGPSPITCWLINFATS